MPELTNWNGDQTIKSIKVALPWPSECLHAVIASTQPSQLLSFLLSLYSSTAKKLQVPQWQCFDRFSSWLFLAFLLLVVTLKLPGLWTSEKHTATVKPGLKVFFSPVTHLQCTECHYRPEDEPGYLWNESLATVIHTRHKNSWFPSFSYLLNKKNTLFIAQLSGCVCTHLSGWSNSHDYEDKPWGQ